MFERRKTAMHAREPNCGTTAFADTSIEEVTTHPTSGSCGRVPAVKELPPALASHFFPASLGRPAANLVIQRVSNPRRFCAVTVLIVSFSIAVLTALVLRVSLSARCHFFCTGRWRRRIEAFALVFSTV